MSNILVVIGSARKGRIADKILDYIQDDLMKRTDTNVTVVDLVKVDLPFFNNENPPFSPKYVITDPRVERWSEMVQASDSIVFITPEYNHTLSAIQKNALDSLGHDWANKPVTAVAYGWSGGSRAVATLQEVLKNLKTDVKQNMAQLRFKADIDIDGTILDEKSVKIQISTAIDEIMIACLK